MLSQTIDERLILIDVNAKNFEDAIRQATNPLVHCHFVTNNYVEKIIEISHDIGPYIVITKNVALPHAPSDSGTLKTALGFTKLKRPVVSGNKANDPVKYLFPLSASDGHSHIEMLSDLATLLSHKDFVNQLEKNSTKEDFITLLKEFEGGESHDA